MEGDFIVINFFALVLVKETILAFFFFIMSRLSNFSKDVHDALVQSWCKSSHAQLIGPDL